MGLSLRKLFKAREKPGEDVQRVSSVEIADQQVRDAVTEICLRELAFWTCVGKIANALTKCEFRTFYEGEELFKDEYYLWNYEPNRNQNKAEFLSKAMEQLFRNNELLIVESYDGQLLVADDFSVTKNTLYGDTYTNVQVDDYTFSRSFRSSDVLHWTLNNKNVNRIMQHLYDLDTLMESNRQIFLEKSNLEEQQLIDMMEAETFLTPEKALEYGLIDRVDSYQADDKDVQQRLMSRVQQLSGVIAQQKSFREQLESMRQQGGEPKPPVPTPKPEPEEKKLTNQLAKLFQNM